MLKLQIQYQIIILYGIHHIPLLEGNLLLPQQKIALFHLIQRSAPRRIAVGVRCYYML